MAEARCVAFLRGVSPMNCRMPELKAAFEAAGFTKVKTLLSSGNVVFSAKAGQSADALQRKAEAAMTKALGRSFFTVVRPASALCRLLASDPYPACTLPATAKRVVTFFREPQPPRPGLPIELDGAQIVSMAGSEVFSAYVPSPRGPVFMSLIEKTFGTDQTTRTWDTVRKCLATAEAEA